MPKRCVHLIGKCNRDYLEWFAGEKLSKPRILLRSLTRAPQHRVVSDHQNASQILVALFRDRPELLFATGRIFARHKSDPGRQITTRSEGLRIHAPITPMPGMVSSRLLISFERCWTMIRFSIDPIIVCTA
jgi:hypothetical protein